MIKCQHEGCECEATHFPRLMIPFMGQPRDTTEPLGATLGIYLCKAHCEEFDHKEVIDPENDGNLREMFDMLAAYGPKCDYDQAFIMPMSFSEPLGIKLMADLERSSHEHYEHPGHA